MGRGGRRENAGRNRLIDHLGRMWIGAQCENRFQQMWEDARQRAWSMRRGADELGSLQEENLAELRSLPIDERAEYHDSIAGQDRSEQIEQVIREMRNTPDFVEHTNRVFTLTASRPKGVKPKICAEVAAEFAAKWGIPTLGPRYAQRCWDEYRAFEKDTRPDSD